LVVEAERKLYNIPFVGEVGNNSERPSNEHPPGDVVGNPASWSTQCRYRHQCRCLKPMHHPHFRTTLPTIHSGLTTLAGIPTFDTKPTHFNNKPVSPLNQLPLINPDTPRSPLPPQGRSEFSLGHRVHPSQSSIASGSGSAFNYYPPTPTSPFQNIPQRLGRGSGFT